jgi:hypothetical protein
MHIGAIEPDELDDLVATDGTCSAAIRLIREHLLPFILFSLKLKSCMRPC